MTEPVIDPFGRQVSYLRVSVTDRCDMRCVYCMSEEMIFLPRPELLSFEEMEQLCVAFIRSGVRRMRITGGEPLVRRGVIDFMARLGLWLGGEHGQPGLDELTLTTNGSRLSQHAQGLHAAGEGASTSVSTRSIPVASRPSPVSAGWSERWTGSRRHGRPDWRCASIRWRCAT